MNGENKNLYDSIYEALINLGFKVRNKQDLVDIAAGLNVNTLKTKEGLLANIAKKLSDILSLDFKDISIPDLHVSNLLNSIKNRGLPKNMEPMIKEILIEAKKNILKKNQKTTNNISTPVSGIMSPASNNSMYSYSPTVQNYNIMYPYLPNYANYPNYSNYLNYPGYPNYTYPYSMFPFGGMNLKGAQYPMMSNPAVLAAMQQMKPSDFTMPNFEMPSPASLATQQQETKPQINPSTLPQNPTKQFKLVNHVTPSSATQIPKTVNPNYLELTHNKMLESSQPKSQNLLRTVKSPQTSQSPSEIKQIKSDHSIKQSKVAKQSKPSKQQQKIDKPQTKTECICNNRGKGNMLKCYHCSVSFHTDCLLITNWSKRQKDNFECPRCIIRRIDPLNEVTGIFMQQIINFRQTPSYQRNLKIQTFIPRIVPQNVIIEIRSIRIDGVSNYQISWPDYANLETVDKIVEFKPLQANSSMKKRKDQIIVIDKTQVIKTKTIRFKIELKTATKELQRGFRIREEGLYIIGIYLIKKMSNSDLVEKLCSAKSHQLPMEQSKNKIMKHFNDNQDICLQKLTIKLHDPILLNKIKIPGRGIFCQHPQCFGLDTFVHMMSRLQHRSWKCPICNYRCPGLYKDPYIFQILNNSPQNKYEVQFYPNGQYNLLSTKDEEEDSEPVNKKPHIESVIIDDDSEVVVVQNKEINVPVESENKVNQPLVSDPPPINNQSISLTSNPELANPEPANIIIDPSLLDKIQ